MFFKRQKNERPDMKPAWALKLRSPFSSDKPVTSWLGGSPRVPSNFQWPKGKGRKYLHFLGQIDLQTLQDSKFNMDDFLGIPSEGSLLLFAGSSFIITAAENHNSQPLEPPAELEPLKELGFWLEGKSFKYWPVDPVAYESTIVDDQRPKAFPERFQNPGDWITNCAIASLDAEQLFLSVARQISEAAGFFHTSKRPRSDAPPPGIQKVLDEKNRIYAVMLKIFPEFLMVIADYQSYLNSKSPLDRPDPKIQEAFFAKRLSINNQIELNFSNIKRSLSGHPSDIWDQIIYNSPGHFDFEGFAKFDQSYHEFLEAMITDWRGHRLFGIEPEFPNNHENLKGMSPVISIAADQLLATQSEHEYGMSNWCLDKRMKKADFSKGKFIRHCAV